MNVTQKLSIFYFTLFDFCNILQYHNLDFVKLIFFTFYLFFLFFSFSSSSLYSFFCFTIVESSPRNLYSIKRNEKELNGSADCLLTRCEVKWTYLFRERRRMEKYLEEKKKYLERKKAKLNQYWETISITSYLLKKITKNSIIDFSFSFYCFFFLFGYFFCLYFLFFSVYFLYFFSLDIR